MEAHLKTKICLLASNQGWSNEMGTRDLAGFVLRTNLEISVSRSRDKWGSFGACMLFSQQTLEHIYGV